MSNFSLFKNVFETPTTSGWIEIFILTMIFYSTFRLFRRTRGAAIFSGLVLVYGILYAVTSLSHLDVLNWLLSRVMIYLFLAFIIIFQPEIRRVLARLGRQSVWKNSGIASQEKLVEPITKAVLSLSKQKIGALIAIERDIGTRALQDTGTLLKSIVSSELLISIFFPRSPLHDGGVIISGDRIRAAGCIFPLSEKEELSKTLGTRHRAAIGITEETDAVVVIVSEETGTISIAYNGRIRSGFNEERLSRALTAMLRRERTGLARFREKLKSGEASLSDTVLINFSEDNDEE
jgi:diadenylate cyclase